MGPFKTQLIPNLLSYNQSPVSDMYGNLMANAPPVSYDSLSSFGVSPQQVTQATDTTSSFMNPNGFNPNGVNQSLFGNLFPNTGGALDNINLGASSGSSLFGDLFGKFGNMNANDLNTGMSALSSGAKLLLGMKQYGLAKDQLDENKRRYDQNYNAQRTTTNAQLEDQQRARVASNPGAYQSVDTYMNKNRIV